MVQVAALARIRSLAWELSYASGAATKKKKRERSGNKAVLSNLKALTCVKICIVGILSFWEN